jgi:hypothetical protein
VPADHPALGGPFDVNAEQKQPSDAGH